MKNKYNELDSPYKKLNYFYLHDIPFLPLSKRGNAVNCRIGQSNQLVFIPKSYFDDDLNLINNNLEWFYNKADTQRKIEKYKTSK